MGLENREVGNFITIYNGKFSKKIKKPDNIVSPEDIEKFLRENNAIARVNKLGETVYEIYHDSFTGKLVGLKVKDGKYGKDWIFSFQDKGDIYLLQLPYTNGFAKNIIKMLPNADLSKEMKVTPMLKVEADGTKKSSVFINQDGVALKHAYTRDNKNGMPDMEEITVKGVKVWDDTQQMIFLEKAIYNKYKPSLWSEILNSYEVKYPKDTTEMVNENIIPKLGSATPSPVNANAPVDELEDYGKEVLTEDEPF